jgi:DMSO/TMAO reductase YedYZ molybdopterin-dependent catalytic subunit
VSIASWSRSADTLDAVADASQRRRTNLALLVAVPGAVFTGLFANTIGRDWAIDPVVVHGVAGFAVAAIAPWKSTIVARGARRRRSSRWASYALLVLVATTLASGLIHAADAATHIGPLAVMQIHVGSGLIALALLVLHYRAHPVKPSSDDLGRRNFIRTAGLAGLATAIWVGWEQSLAIADSSGADRRFTGSHERSSFDPSGMPVTQWFDDRVQHIDRNEWRLDIDGVEYAIDDLTGGQEALAATLDCTSGWYSEQRWEGIRLDRLIGPTSTRSIEVRSVTGYSRRFPVRDLDRMWLVTHVGGAPLSAGHGFPARIVIPHRRGFWWVKWVVRIRTSNLPWWVQSPFPLT